MNKLICKKSSLQFFIIMVVLFSSYHSFAADHNAESTISFEAVRFQGFNAKFKMGLASLKYSEPRKQLSVDYFTDALRKLSVVHAYAPESAQGRLKIIEGEIFEAIGNIKTGNIAEAKENTVRIRSQMFLMHVEHKVVTTEDYLLVWHNGVTHRVEALVEEQAYEELKWMKAVMGETLEKMGEVPFGADSIAYQKSYNVYMNKCVTPYYEALAVHDDPHAMVDPENALRNANATIDATGKKLHSKFFGAIYLNSFNGVDWPTPYTP